MSRVPPPSLDVCFQQLLWESNQSIELIFMIFLNKIFVFQTTLMWYFLPKRSLVPATLNLSNVIHVEDMDTLLRTMRKSTAIIARKMAIFCWNAAEDHKIVVVWELTHASGSTSSASSSSSSFSPTITLESVKEKVAMGFSGNRSSKSSVWYIDSGASNHMTWSSNYFYSLSP